MNTITNKRLNKLLKDNLKELPVYLFNDIEGVLLDDVECARNNIDFYAHEYIGQVAFIPLSELTEKEITKSDCRLAESDYGMGYVEETDIEIQDIVARENEQKLLTVWELSIFKNDNEYQKEMMITTNKYYEWTSYRAEFVEKYSNELLRLTDLLAATETDEDEEEIKETKKEIEKLKENAKTEWEEENKKYKLDYYEYVPFEEVFDEIESRI